MHHSTRATKGALVQGEVLGGRYKVHSHIGGGGMAQVYLAEDEQSPGTRVAIKLINTEHSHKKRSLERFRRECALMRKLQHPNLVRGLDQGVFESRPYIVMEYIDGPCVEDLIKKRGRLRADEALKLLLDVALGLDHLFVRGAMQAHRDIKPTNILVTTGGTAKIADFGIAKAVAESESMTLTSSFLGSPHYMSPEQISDPRSADIRSDLYALGAVFYEMLTGEKAYPGNSTKDVLDAHFELEAPRIKVNDPVDVVCNEILAKTLVFEVGDRYQTPRELVDCLAPAVGTEVTVSMPRFASRNLKMIGAGVAALIVATALTGWVVSGTRAEPNPPTQESTNAAVSLDAQTSSGASTPTPASVAATTSGPNAAVAPPAKPQKGSRSGSAGGVSVPQGKSLKPLDINKAIKDASQ